MAIDYDFYAASNLKGAKGELYARPVGGHRRTTAHLAHHMEYSTTASQADIHLVLGALAVEVTTELLAGNSVQIDGLGTFSIAMKGDIGRDASGRLTLKNAAVRTVNFRPSTQLMSQLRQADFTRARHLGRQSRSVTEAQMLAAARELCEADTVFSAEDFRARLHLTKTTAWKHLRQLVETGRLRQLGGRRMALYALPQDGAAAADGKN